MRTSLAIDRYDDSLLRSPFYIIMANSITHKLFLSSVLVMLSSCTPNRFSAEPDEVAETTLKFGGSSETYEVLGKLADAFSQETEEVTIDFLPPSQTSGGIEGIISQFLDVAGVSREITANEAGETLTYQPLIDIPLVLVAHHSVTGVTDISPEQIRAIYSGEISNWQELGGPDADIVVFDFTEDDNEKQVLRQTYLGNNLEVTPDAIIFGEDDELLSTAATIDFSFAATPLSDELEQLPMTILSIDNVRPTIDNIQSGAYSMTLQLGIVISNKPSAMVQSFTNFVSSPAGQEVLADISQAVAEPY
ncbi:MAG: substrate-binding domain-containing protein [Cyanobacteria bacterium P01_A01_bin.37]